MSGFQIAVLVLAAVLLLAVNVFVYLGAAEARRFGQRRFVPLLALGIVETLLVLWGAVLVVILLLTNNNN